jgi:hypothetical protein
MTDEYHEKYEEVLARLTKASRDQLRPALSEFLEPYTPAPGAFIDQCYNAPGNVTARMLHSLHRLVGFADNSGPDELKVFWLCVCAESEVKLSGNDPGGSRNRVISFFERNVQENDQDLLETSFKRHLGDDKFFNPNNPNFDPAFPTTLTLGKIIGVLYSVRNQMVHGYETYGFHFSDDIVPMMNYVDVSGLGKPPEIEIYAVGISYQKFRGIFVRAGIACIRKYLCV